MPARVGRTAQTGRAEYPRHPSIQVKECTLDRLHEHVQLAFGWWNYHLHQFQIGDITYGAPWLLSDPVEEVEFEDSTQTRLCDIMPKSGQRFRFQCKYDFGDCWEHEILFEGCLRAEKHQRYPKCLEGRRACPPEDVGGVDGYYRYLESMADPEHEEHEDFMAWRGPYDPDKFDAKKTTKTMRRGMPKPLDDGMMDAVFHQRRTQKSEHARKRRRPVPSGRNGNTEA